MEEKAGGGRRVCLGQKSLFWIMIGGRRSHLGQFKFSQLKRGWNDLNYRDYY